MVGAGVICDRDNRELDSLREQLASVNGEINDANVVCLIFLPPISVLLSKKLNLYMFFHFLDLSE